MSLLRAESLFRQMKIILFYDLPTITKKDRAEFAKFRKEIEKLGFFMIQESIYIKHCFNHDWVDRTKIKLARILPKTDGDIRILIITEKQYQTIEVLKGEKSLQENYLSKEELLRF